MAQEPHGPLRSFGRLKSRPIKPRQAALVEARLPGLSLASVGPVDPSALKRNAVETWLEIGFGGGEHMVEQAARHPDVLVLGAEPFLNGAASAIRHIAERELDNVRLHVGDARDLVSRLPDASLARAFVLFPDPWPKARHRKRRLLQPSFAAELARVLRPGGRLRFVTDWADYANEALVTLRAERRLRWTARRAGDWAGPPADHVPTRYEAKRLGDCAPVFLDFERT